MIWSNFSLFATVLCCVSFILCISSKHVRLFLGLLQCRRRFYILLRLLQSMQSTLVWLTSPLHCNRLTWSTFLVNGNVGALPACCIAQECQKKNLECFIHLAQNQAFSNSYFPTKYVSDYHNSCKNISFSFCWAKSQTKSYSHVIYLIRINLDVVNFLVTFIPSYLLLTSCSFGKRHLVYRESTKIKSEPSERDLI